MKKNEILDLYRYNSWANARILNATSNVSPEQFLNPGAFCFGDLRGTLVHILFAEWIWRRRWEGHAPTEWLKPEDIPSFDKLHTYWQAEEDLLMAFVKNVSDENLGSVIRYKQMSGESRENTLWHLMVHLVNHGTQHRSEAAAMLTEFGHSPGDIDLVIFLRERS